MEKSLLRNKSTWGFLSLLYIGAICFSVVASEIAGTSGAYLRAPLGASAHSLAGAYTADPASYAAWWNPSVLSFVKKPKAGIGTGLQSLGRTLAYASYEFRVPPRVGMGIVALYRGDPSLNGIHDADENIIGDGSYTTLTCKIAAAYFVNRVFSVGASIGIMYQRLPTSLTEDGIGYTSTTGGIGSFDFAATWIVNNRWQLATVLSNIGSSMNWEINTGDFMNPTIEDHPLPSLTLASTYKGTFLGKPLLWSCDLKGYYFDGEWNALPHADLTINNGVEWCYWDIFSIRAGLGDFSVNSDIVNDMDQYKEDFSLRAGAGFSLDLTRIKKGLVFNYGVSTDKSWAGIDQQLDLSYTF